jgi:hypothetical protein
MPQGIAEPATTAVPEPTSAAARSSVHPAPATATAPLAFPNGLFLVEPKPKTEATKPKTEAASDGCDTPAINLSSSPRLCDNAECRKPLHKLLQCSNCKSVAYCSMDCQVCELCAHRTSGMHAPDTRTTCIHWIAGCTHTIYFSLKPSHIYTYCSRTRALSLSHTNAHKLSPSLALVCRPRHGRPDTSASARRQRKGRPHNWRRK